MQRHGRWLRPLTWVLVAVRLAFEMRVSRWATAFLAIATVGYLAGLMTAQLTVQPISQMLVVFASSALLTIGHLGVFVSVLVFGRHVYLDSQGLLPARSAKPRRTKVPGTRSRTGEEKIAPQGRAKSQSRPSSRRRRTARILRISSRRRRGKGRFASRSAAGNGQGRACERGCGRGVGVSVVGREAQQDRATAPEKTASTGANAAGSVMCDALESNLARIACTAKILACCLFWLPLPPIAAEMVSVRFRPGRRTAGVFARYPLDSVIP